MSRPLKFRAWDDTKKEWTLNIMECVSSRTGNIWMEPARKFHKVVIEQYTGLKDIHGKEICEGDIVFDWRSRLHDGYRYKDTYIVKWDKDKVSFVLEYADEEFNGFYMFNDYEDLEIIGNIHENPELLEMQDMAKAFEEMDKRHHGWQRKEQDES